MRWRKSDARFDTVCARYLDMGGGGQRTNKSRGLLVERDHRLGKAASQE